MGISIFDLYSIGIGPSSSHTIGPMISGKRFLENVSLEHCTRIKIDVYGSLALTGKGHGTPTAILLGLSGYEPETVDPKSIPQIVEIIKSKQSINLLGKKNIHFNINNDIEMHFDETLPLHTNGMRFSSFEDKTLLLSEVYYSIGGGFIVREDEYGKDRSKERSDFCFDSAKEMMALCKQHHFTIGELQLEIEKKWHSKKEVLSRLDKIDLVMEECIEAGCHTPGILPGGLDVKRRAPEMFGKLIAKGKPNSVEQTDSMFWLNLYALAVNEENAAGGKIVTAPTNGAAGIVPAVLNFYKNFYPDVTKEKIHEFLLTAGAIAILYKKGASISGAEVGCQGEVGTAASMAAAALCAVSGGTLAQIENAAEIAMEHHLGLTCDPIAGLVQIPCIERNAMGAVKAVNAVRLAMLGDGEHKVPLDKVIATMKQTGLDMMSIYKETSLGGLAANIPEC